MIALVVLVFYLSSEKVDSWRGEMKTDWNKTFQPLMLGSVAIGGITQVTKISKHIKMVYYDTYYRW